LERLNSDLVKIYTPLIKMILRSPLHGLMSQNTMLISFRGRKSGKIYTTPVGYVQEGNCIIFFEQSHSTWWKNLRGGAPVIVRVRGRNLKAIGEAIQDQETVTTALSMYVRKLPQYAKFFVVTIGPDGLPNQEEVARAAQNRVMMRVTTIQEKTHS
jgi:deazaflavin-dependent oxidoreductase (nitroreductase family)